ncbi:MAG: Gfo/Idh/MocA family oxidoreductase, partial [Desulfobacterales bacterium]
MGNSKLGILIHGAGWVSTQHIQAYKNNPFTEIVAISSRTLEGAQARADDEGLDVPVFDDYKQALAVSDVDIVSVCTPQHLHADNVVLAAEARKHIVIEKPACQNLDELKRMQIAVKNAQVKTIVSFVLRWNPLFEMLKRMTRDDAFGEIYSVEA